MKIVIDTVTVRKTTLTDLYTAQAIDLGFRSPEARRRAALWFDCDEIVRHGNGSTDLTALDGGEIDSGAVWTRTLPTDRLQAMVDKLRNPPPPVPYQCRHGWGPGPDGLSP